MLFYYSCLWKTWPSVKRKTLSAWSRADEASESLIGCRRWVGCAGRPLGPQTDSSHLLAEHFTLSWCILRPGQRKVAFVLPSIRPSDFITPLIAILIISLKALISCSNDSALSTNLEGEGQHARAALLLGKGRDISCFFLGKRQAVKEFTLSRVSLAMR